MIAIIRKYWKKRKLLKYLRVKRESERLKALAIAGWNEQFQECARLYHIYGKALNKIGKL